MMPEFPMADTVNNSQLRVHHCLWGIYTHTHFESCQCMQQRPRGYIGGALHPGKILDLHSHQYFIEWVVFFLLSRYRVTRQTSV